MIKLRIGGVPEHFNLPWHVSLQVRRFEPLGVDVTWRDYAGGSGAMAKALRDGELDLLDYRKNARVYLPQDDMARFGVTERHLEAMLCDDAWRRLMAFQVERTRRLMLRGSGLGKSLPGRIGLEIRATIQGGLRILEKIESAGYDVFRRRPKLRTYDWPLLVARAL